MLFDTYSSMGITCLHSIHTSENIKLLYTWETKLLYFHHHKGKWRAQKIILLGNITHTYDRTFECFEYKRDFKKKWRQDTDLCSVFQRSTHSFSCSSPRFLVRSKHSNSSGSFVRVSLTFNLLVLLVLIYSYGDLTEHMETWKWENIV